MVVIKSESMYKNLKYLSRQIVWMFHVMVYEKDRKNETLKGRYYHYISRCQILKFDIFYVRIRYVLLTCDLLYAERRFACSKRRIIILTWYRFKREDQVTLSSPPFLDFRGLSFYTEPFEWFSSRINIIIYKTASSNSSL